MGKKQFLGSINITDDTSTLYYSSHPDDTDATTDFNKCEFITCVYDEDEEDIELYSSVAFEAIVPFCMSLDAFYHLISVWGMAHCAYVILIVFAITLSDLYLRRFV